VVKARAVEGVNTADAVHLPEHVAFSTAIKNVSHNGLCHKADWRFSLQIPLLFDELYKLRCHRQLRQQPPTLVDYRMDTAVCSIEHCSVLDATLFYEPEIFAFGTKARVLFLPPHPVRFFAVKVRQADGSNILPLVNKFLVQFFCAHHLVMDPVALPFFRSQPAPNFSLLRWIWRELVVPEFEDQTLYNRRQHPGSN
jgi:hypothetical protein